MREALNFVVHGLRYHDRKNGNTYHAVRIFSATTSANRCLLGTVPFTYGYGDQWKHSAMDFLIKNGYWKEEDRHDHEKKRALILFIGGEYVNQRDLKAHGSVTE